MKKGWIKYAVTFAVGLIISAAIAFSRGFSFAGDAQANARWLSDGCFISGLMLGGVGVLMWVSTTGFFDIFSYGVRSLLVLFTALKKPQEHQKYFEYKQSRDENRGKPQFFMLLVGVVFVALSLVCLAVYYG